MRPLLVNASDLLGGAARAAYRLLNALVAEGIDAHMMVQTKFGDDHRVEGPPKGIARALARMRPTLDLMPVKRYPRGARTMFSPARIPFSGLVDRINSSDADVVHLHWINGGMLRVEDLAAIRRPLVWSLHDMWAFTGGCHYDEECGKWSTHCGQCPVLGSTTERDLSHAVFRRKLATYAKLEHLTIVGLSKWMATCAEDSPLLKGRRVVNLPNPIDTNAFKPVDKLAARRILGLPEDRKLVLFGAVNATADQRKGFAQITAALRALTLDRIELVVFGASRPSDPPDLGHPVHYLGHLHDDASLCVLYNAADITVLPSLQENLSNTVVESLACGTPVAAFDIGGNADMVDHHVNGALAKPFDPDDLAACIRWVLEHPEPMRLSDAARRIALERYAMTPVARRYVELYGDVIRGTVR